MYTKSTWRWNMKTAGPFKLFSIICACVLVAFVASAGAQQAPQADVQLKLDGAKMAPVSFPHAKHAKVDCAKCHHKGDAKEPKKCASCHDVKDVKDGAAVAKDAFHKLCQDCHKAEAAKGAKAPTKCNECHKK
jgi:RecJ-like exonuclease